MCLDKHFDCVEEWMFIWSYLDTFVSMLSFILLYQTDSVFGPQSFFTILGFKELSCMMSSSVQLHLAVFPNTSLYFPLKRHWYPIESYESLNFPRKPTSMENFDWQVAAPLKLTSFEITSFPDCQTWRNRYAACRIKGFYSFFIWFPSSKFHIYFMSMRIFANLGVMIKFNI